MNLLGYWFWRSLGEECFHGWRIVLKWNKENIVKLKYTGNDTTTKRLVWLKKMYYHKHSDIPCKISNQSHRSIKLLWRICWLSCCNSKKSGFFVVVSWPLLCYYCSYYKVAKLSLSSQVASKYEQAYQNWFCVRSSGIIVIIDVKVIKIQ